MKCKIIIEYDENTGGMLTTFEGSAIVHAGMIKYAAMKIENHLLTTIKCGTIDLPESVEEISDD